MHTLAYHDDDLSILGGRKQTDVLQRVSIDQEEVRRLSYQVHASEA